MVKNSCTIIFHRWVSHFGFEFFGGKSKLPFWSEHVAGRTSNGESGSSIIEFFLLDFIPQNIVEQIDD